MIEARPADVTSYKHPPAKEHSKPEELAETESSLASVVAETAKCLTSLFVKDRRGASAVNTVGTPRVKVAVAWVLESTTTESASMLANEAVAVKSARSKLVPVNTIVVSVLLTDVTSGNAELDTCSYWQLLDTQA